MMPREQCRAFLLVAACVASWVFSGSVVAAVRLELKLDKGKTWYERMLIDQRITQVMGQEQVTSFTIGIIQKLDVLDVDDRGNMRIRHTYAWTRFKQASAMLPTVDYDSSRQATPPSGAEGFAALVGQSYTIKAGPRGEVLEIAGMEELAEAVRKKLPPGADPSEGTDALSTFLDKEAMRELTEASMAVYPDRPVEPGDSWTRTQLARRGFARTAESKWTLQKREGGVATISAVSSIKADPNGPPLKTHGMAMKMELSGSEENTIQMEEVTGLIRSSRGRQQLKGQIKVGASAEGPFDMMAIPMTPDSTFTTEASDKMWEMKAQ